MERVEIICPNCRASYKIHRQFLGKYAKCKKCGQSFLAAESDHQPEQSLSDLEEAANSEAGGNDFAKPIPPLPPPMPPRLATISRPPAYAAVGNLPRRRAGATVNFDWIAPLILLSYLLMLVMIGIHLTAAAIPFFIKPPGAIDGAGYVWLRLFLSAVLFFVIVGPASWGAVMLAAKIGREDPGYSSYLRASSIAVLPILTILFIALITPTREGVIVGLVIILPLAFVCLKLIFDFDWPWTVLAFFFGLIFVIPAHLISAGILNWSMHAIRGDIAPAAQVATNLPRNSTSAIPGYNNNSSATVTAQPQSRAEALRHRLESFDSEDFTNQSRESLQKRLASFKLDAESIRATSQTDPNMAEVDRLLAAIETKSADALSGKPDEFVFKPILATTDWSAPAMSSAVSPPVSYKTYLVSGPTEAKFDLASSEESATGFTWSLGFGTKISYKTQPLYNPEQQRPWIIAKPFMREQATREKLFAIDAANNKVDTGLINGIPFTRVQSPAPGVTDIQYIARETDTWLIIEITSRGDAGKSLDVLESAARSIKRAPSGTVKIDAFAPDRIAPRLVDDEAGASRILRLHGKAAEDAVLEQLQKGGGWSKRAAAVLLAEIGTEKSIPALTDAAKSNDSSLADAAKTALTKLSPTKMDPVALALMDLEATSSFKRADALKALANAKADDRRAEIAPKLESLLLNDKVFPSEYDDVANAIAVWSRKETVGNLIPLLDEEHGSMFKRQAAMKALGKIGDAKAAYPIARWLIKDSKNAADALIAIGPGAEDEMVKLLREKNATARMQAARVLEKVGTGKSLNELHRASNDPRDKPAADAAKQAEEAIRQRIKDQKK